MEAKKSKKKIIIASAAAALVFIGVIVAAYILWYPKPVQGEKHITVEIVFADNQTKSIPIDTSAQFLRGALDEQKLIAGDEGEYGLFVKTVDGITADAGKEQWWCFTKGGGSLATSVDQTPIADGDAFEITLKTGYSQ